MIITKLQGGLGNQMFQYAAGLALSIHRRTILKLDISWYKNDPSTQAHDRYGLHCFNILEQFASRQEVASFFPPKLTQTERWTLRFLHLLNNKQATALYQQPGATYFQRDWGYDASFWGLPGDCHLEGYFQNASFFEPIQEIVRQHFTFRFPPTETVLSWAERISNSKNPVFVHFRRGDYLGQNAIYGALRMDYYRKAMETLKRRLGTFTVFVFSDDIDSVEKELRLDLPHYFVRATEHHNFFDKIRLMALCDHAIISNSTFAWWGAWLIPNKEKIVIAPRPWHGDGQFANLNPAPDSWLREERA